MNIAMIIPTGIGCDIGGHAGDASPAAKLLASVCDNLIVHPNVVNASDINEMTDNMWYVEGSMLDRFLRNEIQLYKPKSNRILLVVNDKAQPDTINAVSAARVTLGADIQIMELKTPLRVTATKRNGKASGDVTGWEELIEQVNEVYDEFDALAIQTLIHCPEDIALDYRDNGGVNPWGGAESKLSRMISDGLNKPVAHAPIESDYFKTMTGKVVDPRMAPEFVSISYLHCILKGLHKAPRIIKHEGLTTGDIDYLVSPYGCIGEPHWACRDNGIPIIVVKENNTIEAESPLSHKIKPIMVENYLEAVGMIQLLECGMTRESVTRPIKETIIK